MRELAPLWIPIYVVMQFLVNKFMGGLRDNMERPRDTLSRSYHVKIGPDLETAVCSMPNWREIEDTAMYIRHVAILHD